MKLSAVDIERNRLFFASSANFIYTTQAPSPQVEEAWSRASVAASTQLIDLETGDFITCLEYAMEKEALIIGTSEGLLLLYSVDDNATEIVGRVEGGVRCISPSPDGDLLALITGFGQILVMNLDWDLLYEMPLDDLPEGVDIHESAFSADSSEPSISWRGDEKFFASLSKVYDSFPLHKKLKVWERDSGVLLSVSDPKPFMGSVVDWSQSGAKIAAVYNREEENQCPSVVFFEKNGLERSSFRINETMHVTLEFLKFNCNSDLLAAIVRGEVFDTLKIWYFSNSHWYLKQEMRYSKEDKVKFMWDLTDPLKLICWTLAGRIITCKFVWVTAVIGNSTAFVIDGSKVLVTPFSLSLIPPPMSFLILEFPNGSLCVVELPLLDLWDELEDQIFKIEASYCGINYGPLLHVAWLDSHMLLGVSHFGSGPSNSSKRASPDGDVRSGYYLHEIEIRCFEDRVAGSVTCSGWHAESLHQLYLEGLVISIAPNTLSRYSAFVQLEGGKAFDYTSKLGLKRGDRLQRYDDMNFLSTCPRMDVAPIQGYARERPLLLGLDDNGRLHLEGRILCNNCSNFSFYSNSGNGMITHVIIATKQDLLFIVDVGDIVQGQLEKYDNFVPFLKKKKGENESISINIWEKGAQIVGVLHGDESAVILQTLRGNLECVFPRKLVLTSIINALAQGRFKDALQMVRRHRIDFNLIVDHCGWQAFIGSAADFVMQVNNLNHITEFACAIKHENVMETLYRNCVSLPCLKGDKGLAYGEPKGTDSDNKVSSVLMAIRKALEEQIEETPARELCILTTLAKSSPPALEEALRRIKVVRELELSAATDPKRLLYPSSEESLKHLLWLSDSEAVFEAALGLYDLNLAAIVALNSQKDPKEFLPFLQELECMPTILMQYNIDLKLQRYESALRHIISAGDHYYEDCMNLIRKVPELFPLGLQLIGDPPKRQQVLEAWGDHLNATKCFEDAATTYLCCSCLEKALKAYRACGNWMGVLTVAGLIKLGKDDLLLLARELSEELQALGKPGDAAKILLEYCGDIDNGISLLVEARNWEEALRVTFLHRRDDMTLVVKSASLECASMLVGEYNDGVEKVGKYLTRYLAVRQRRLLLAATIKTDKQSMSYLDDETASQASSNFSGMSAYTTGTRKGSSASTTISTSTKGRGRQRNRGKIRAGSPDEEMALVEHLKGMSLSEGAKCELKSLLICLVMLGEEATARKLQRTAEKFQLSQVAAVKLAGDSISSDIIDEHAFTLDHYIQYVRKNLQNSDAFSWRLKVLV
ncbi:hypothetical protein ACS0TY_002904 [Phlomoides rotata]